jgi:hypothetical protein
MDPWNQFENEIDTSLSQLLIAHTKYIQNPTCKQTFIDYAEEYEDLLCEIKVHHNNAINNISINISIDEINRRTKKIIVFFCIGIMNNK